MRRFAARAVAPLTLALAPLAGAAQGIDDWAFLASEAPAAWATLQDAEAYCAKESEGGQLVITEGGIVFTDLDGDNGRGPSGEPDDVVVDFNRIGCDRAISLWSGTGGSPVVFVLDGAEAGGWTGFDWEVERFGPDLPAVILLARHGSACDGYGAAPCVQAIVAADGAFWTVAYPEEWAGFGAE